MLYTFFVLFIDSTGSQNVWLRCLIFFQKRSCFVETFCSSIGSWYIFEMLRKIRYWANVFKRATKDVNKKAPAIYCYSATVFFLTLQMFTEHINSNFFKGCLPQILLGPFLNILHQMILILFWLLCNILISVIPQKFKSNEFWSCLYCSAK